MRIEADRGTRSERPQPPRVLAPGRYADIIAVRGDPLTDMTVMRDVRIVINGGSRVR